MLDFTTMAGDSDSDAVPSVCRFLDNISTERRLRSTSQLINGISKCSIITAVLLRTFVAASREVHPSEQR